MQRMRTCDFSTLNASVLALNIDDRSETLSSRLARALATLISFDFAAVECFDETATWKGRLFGDSEGLIDRFFPAFLRIGGTHPLFGPFLAGHLYREPIRLSDVTTQSALHSSAIYDEFLRPLGVNRQVALALALPDGSSEVIILSRKDSDFTRRDIDLLKVFLPHLVCARHRCVFLSKERLFLRREHKTQARLQDTLMLTKREAEIVWWLTRGKTDKDIAQICGISDRTVQKHCENIYRKCGVEGRTAAVIKALEQV